MSYIRLKVPREARGQRLDLFLSRTVPGFNIDRAHLLLAQGHVLIDGKRAQGTRKLWGGEALEVAIPSPRSLEKVEGPRIPILFDDARLLVVNKPAGYTVAPEPGQVSIVDLVAAQSTGFDVGGLAEPGVVHRLDRETSGCLLLARTDSAVAELQAAFEARRLEKRYLALVLGHPPPEGSFDTPYARNPNNPRLYTTHERSARRARLSYRVLEQHSDAARVEIHLETGRTHQIRAQMSDAGFPVLGDPLYGNRETRDHPAALALERMALHAWKLALHEAPGSAGFAAEAPVPAAFAQAIEKLQ